MTMPLPESAKDALQQLTGPRYRPGAYNLAELATAATEGHAAIAEKVREHAEAVAAEHAAERATRGAESHAEPLAAAGVT